MNRSGLLALAAIAALGAVIFLVPERKETRAPFSTQGLGRFLKQGPSEGKWELCKLSSCFALFVAPHPTEDEELLVGTDGPCSTGDACHAVPRRKITRLMFEASADLFFRNYARRGFAQRDTLDDGTVAMHAVWVPRFDPEGMSARHVWFEESTGNVIQVQDVSRNGHPIRTIRRLSVDTEDWDPATFDPNLKQSEWAPACGSETVESVDELDRIVALAPFPMLVPDTLPKGYELVRATYQECNIRPFNAQQGAPGLAAQLATLLYSDGMGLISIAISPQDDMDAIEAQYGRQMAQVNPDDPQACPGLPAEPQSIRTGGGVVRMRTDKCRTVVRRDGIHGRQRDDDHA